MNRTVNPVLRGLLRSPAHGLASRRLALITHTGRKSGREHTIPVLYRDKGDEVTIAVGWPDRKVCTPVMPSTRIFVWIVGTASRRSFGLQSGSDASQGRCRGAGSPSWTTRSSEPRRRAWRGHWYRRSRQPIRVVVHQPHRARLALADDRLGQPPVQVGIGSAV